MRKGKSLELERFLNSGDQFHFTLLWTVQPSPILFPRLLLEEIHVVGNQIFDRLDGIVLALRLHCYELQEEGKDLSTKLPVDLSHLSKCRFSGRI